MRTTYQLIEKWFEALKNSSFEELFTYMDENILWENSKVISGYNDVIPWLGTYHGIYEVKGTFELYGKLSQSQNFDIVDIVVDGDTAYVQAYETNKVIETDCIYHADVIFKMKCRGEKVISWKAYWDTAEAVAAFKKKACDRQEEPQFLMAAGSGDLQKVQMLLEQGEDINKTDRAGGTALHKACQGGHLEVVKYLVEKGIHLNATMEMTGHTALMDAIWFKQTECCRYLLEKNAAIGLLTTYGFSIDDHIEFALNVNKEPKEKEKLILIRHYVEERRERDKKQAENPLFQAILANDLEGVKLALSNGTDIEMRYPIVNGFNDGHTPLIIASRENEKEIVKYLIEQGADVNSIEPIFGAVPLHKATYNGLPDILKVLLEVEGIDVNFQGCTNGYTPLHDALWHGFEECANILLDYGVNLWIKGYDGKLPVDVAKEVFGEEAVITKRIRKMMQ